jgi:biotin transport system substrate-specific component
LVLYVIGIPYMAYVGQLGMAAAFTGSVVYLPGDVAKAVLAGVVAATVRKAYPLIESARV